MKISRGSLKWIIVYNFRNIFSHHQQPFTLIHSASMHGKPVFSFILMPVQKCILIFKNWKLDFILSKITWLRFKCLRIQPNCFWWLSKLRVLSDILRNILEFYMNILALGFRWLIIYVVVKWKHIFLGVEKAHTSFWHRIPWDVWYTLRMFRGVRMFYGPSIRCFMHHLNVLYIVLIFHIKIISYTIRTFYTSSGHFVHHSNVLYTI